VLGSLQRYWLFRQIAVLMLGRGIALVLSIVASPILTRLFEPSALGLSGTLATLTSFIAVIASLRYEGAIVLEPDDECAQHIFTLSMLLLSGIVLLTLAAAGTAYALSLGGAGVGDILPFVPLSLALVGIQQVLERWLARCKAFRPLAAAQVVRSVLTLVSQVAGGLAGLGWLGLIIGTLIGQASSIAATSWIARRELRGAVTHRPTLRQLRGAAERHREFLLFSAPQALLSTFTYGIPVLLLQWQYTSAAAGHFYLATRIMVIPQQVIGEAVRPVFFRRAAEVAGDAAALYRHFLKLTLILTAVALPMVIALIAAGPELFAFVFGPQWQRAGDYARWLSILLAMEVVTVPAVVVIPLLNLQGRFLVFECVYTVLRLAALYAGGATGTDLSAVADYSAMTGAANIALVLYIGQRLARRRRDDIPRADRLRDRAQSGDGNCCSAHQVELSPASASPLRHQNLGKTSLPRGSSGPR
jgi:O-antigen/teichoic acid export membrane protein